MLHYFKRYLQTSTYYCIPLIIIICWWTLAFRPNKEPPPSSPIVPPKVSFSSPPLITFLSPLERSTLHAALNGDFDLMIKLITDWDHDAQIIEQFGLIPVKKLSREDFLRSQLIARKLKSGNEELNRFNEKTWQPISDDTGQLFDLTKNYRRFLPQSYIAASFLFALSQPEEIVALPRGMREQTFLYPIEKINRVALDTDRYNTEKLYEAQPDIAFVADYSHPSTIEALQKQGIPLFTLKCINSPEEIRHALLRIGAIVNRPLEAELLNYFVEAAMQAIDNRFQVLNAHFNSSNASAKVLFLKHHLTFSTPTSHTLTGKLLKRIGIAELQGDKIAQNTFAWNIPIRQEQIIELSPDYIIISTNSMDPMRTQLLKNNISYLMLKNPPKSIAFVHDSIQESPSQYIVLAYYDLYRALTDAAYIP